MARQLALLVLVLVCGGCRDDYQEADEVKAYVAEMQQLDRLNRRTATLLARLGQLGREPTATDGQEARELIDAYIAKVEEISGSDLEYPFLRAIHDLYRHRLAEAKTLAISSSEVAASLQKIQKATEQHYLALELLWLRTRQSGAYPLAWPPQLEPPSS